MSLARIRTENPANASFLADALRRRGFEVQVLRPEQAATGNAEFEFTLESHSSADAAMRHASEIAERSGCDLLIAPGVLRYEPAKPEPASAAPANPNNQDLEREEPAEEPMLEPAIEMPVPGPAPKIQEQENIAEAQAPTGPTFAQQLLDGGAVLAAAMRNHIERTPEIAGRAWEKIARGGSALARSCGRSCAELAGATKKNWQHARECYAGARAAALARAAEMRAARAKQARLEREQQAREAAAMLVEPVGVAHLPPPTSTRPAAWRTALVGAIAAALVIGIGFAVGAKRTPAAVASPTVQQRIPFGATTVHASAREVGSAAMSRAATEKQNPAKTASSRHRTEAPDSSGDDEVVIRHFTPAKPAAPQVSADGVKHYSDDDNSE